MKYSSIIVLAATLAALLNVGCGSNTAGAPVIKDHTKNFDLKSARKIIEEKNRQFTKAHILGDSATIDNMFTLDAKALPPNADPVIGRAAVAKLTLEYLSYGVSEFSEVTTDFYGTEDLLIDQGDYVMVYGKDKVREKGKYLNVWKKEDGDWKIYSNIWSANAPETPAK